MSEALGSRPTSTGELPGRPRGEVKPICLWPAHEALRVPAREVTPKDQLAQLLADMEATMFAAAGAGLAAPQIGVSLRVAMICVENGLIELVNPRLLEASGQHLQPEGCLSVAPGETLAVRRPDRVRVGWFTPAGEWVEEEARGLLARALQHELDHLEGLVYPNRVGPVAREMIRQKARHFNNVAGSTWTPGGG